MLQAVSNVVLLHGCFLHMCEQLHYNKTKHLFCFIDH